MTQISFQGLPDVLIDAALQYAEWGFEVFPIIPRGKRPATEHGFRDATTDRKTIESWWTKNPNFNIGIRTGSLIAIDLDYDPGKGKDGPSALLKWENEHGELPDTARVRTGRGGLHLYFQTDKEVKCGTDILPGVDVRANGGYIIAPPSIHKNGNRYVWLAPTAPIATANERVFSFLSSGNKERASIQTVERSQSCSVEAGARTNYLVSVSGKLRAAGLQADIIEATLRTVNEKTCDPPLTETELQREVLPVIDRYPLRIIGFSGVCDAIRTEYGEKLSFDILLGRPMIEKVPWAVDRHPLRDEDLGNIRVVFSEKYCFDSKESIRDGLNKVATERQVNPVAEILDSLVWDGQDRIGELFPRYLGAERCEFTTAVTKLILSAAVQRIRNPGCKFDQVVILADKKQGTGKSSICRFLALEDTFFTDSLGDLSDDKRAFEAVSGKFIVEMGELLATRRTADIEAIKSYLSRSADVYRVPYATYPERIPRKFIVIGTTNRCECLPYDATGNRRFIPLLCDGRRAVQHPLANESETREFVKQCYAQAIVEGERDGWSLVLDPKFDEELNAVRAESTPANTVAGTIQEFLDTQTKYDVVCSKLLWYEVFSDREPTRRDLDDISEVMNTQVKGWQKYKGKSGDGASSTYRFKQRFGKAVIGTQRAWCRVTDADQDFVNKVVNSNSAPLTNESEVSEEGWLFDIENIPFE